MLTVLLRSCILYAVSVLAMRLMGKRQVGQLQPYELVVAIMIAELAASPMESVGTPLLYGIVPIGALVVLHGLGSILSAKSVRARTALSGEPSVLVRNGAVQYEELSRLNYSMSDLMEEVRACGVLNIADVNVAILETSGKLSVFPHALKRPVTPEDMQLSPEDEAIPMMLVVDGKPQPRQLAKCGKDEQWLTTQLKKSGNLAMPDVLYCLLDTKGTLIVQDKQGGAPQTRSVK